MMSSLGSNSLKKAPVATQRYQCFSLSIRGSAIPLLIRIFKLCCISHGASAHYLGERSQKTERMPEALLVMRGAVSMLFIAKMSPCRCPIEQRR